MQMELPILLREDANDEIINDSNKYEYIKLRIHRILFDEVEDIFTGIMKGFYSVIPRNIIQQFSYSEIEMLVCGSEIDRQDWKNNTVYCDGFKETDKTVTWFWEIINSLDENEVVRIIEFATASCRAPAGGFGNLPNKFKIKKLRNLKDQFPRAVTCYNSLVLSEFTSKEILQEYLIASVNQPREFGFL